MNIQQNVIGVLGYKMRVTNLTKNKEVKNASWIIGGRIVQMILSLFVGVLTARYLGPSNYGTVNYGTTYVAFFTALCTLGLNSILVKDFVDYPKEQGEAIGSSLVMRLVSSIVSSIMMIAISFVVDNGETLTIVVVALCSLGPIFHVFEVFNYWFQSQYKSKVTSIASLCAYIVTSFYKIILLICGKDVRWFAFATSIDYIVVAIFLFIAYKHNDGPKLKFSLKKSKSLIRISYNYILSSMMVVLYGQTDKFMLKQMINETEVGYYSTAMAICSMWTFILQAIIDSICPSILKLKNIDEASYNRKNKQLYAIVFNISCLVSIFFIFFGKWIVMILYGDDYLSAVPILKIVTWYTAFSYLGVARNAWIICEGKQKYLKYMYGCAAILNIVLNFMMIPLLGAIGAALASVITQVCTSIILPMLNKEMRPNAKLMLDAIRLKM